MYIIYKGSFAWLMRHPYKQYNTGSSPVGTFKIGITILFRYY